MYCKLIPALVLSSLLIPALSLAVPPRAELERRDLAAGSVEILEAREPFKVLKAARTAARMARTANRGFQRVNSVVGNVQRFIPGVQPMGAARQQGGGGFNFRKLRDTLRRAIRRRRRQRALGKRDLVDTEDLSARGFEDDLLDLEAREPSEFDELDARSLFDEIEDLDARSLFEDFEDFEAREFMGEASLDELD